LYEYKQSLTTSISVFRHKAEIIEKIKHLAARYKMLYFQCFAILDCHLPSHMIYVSGEVFGEVIVYDVGRAIVNMARYTHWYIHRQGHWQGDW
jgi:hypothetical protein